ncbi:uncharacterized protein CC84DRAFT_1053918, partial [Paraphaeosphaeria sporulosa]
GAHPMTRLMATAEAQFSALLSSQPANLSDAASKYRQRRGRHPPPGFDKWYAYAQAKNALIPETFFDQINHDLGPFWGIDVVDLRRSARGFSPKVVVRGGVVESANVAHGSYNRPREFLDVLEEMVKEGMVLPDVNLPVNVNDEIAMLVPWGTMETAVEFARRFMPPAEEVTDAFSTPDGDGLEEDETFDPSWLDDRLRHKAGGPYLGPRPLWSLVRPACPPSSATARGELMADIWHPQGHTRVEHSAAALLPLEVPVNSTEGYIANWTVATDVCNRPELQGLHGSFVAPKAMSVTQKLFPLFSTSKMSASNEVLVPAFSPFNSSNDTPPLPWAEKEKKLHWRGPASGGANSNLNWQRLHRNRFVSMMNATHIEVAEGMLHAGNETTVGLGYAGNFRLLPSNAYRLTSQKGAKMAEWVSGWADAGFTDLQCDESGENSTCSYIDEFFSVKEPASVGLGKYKYAAILDGDAGDDGGELVQRFEEGRVVFRASAYKQWHDSRLIPWLHYVPMDNTFIDIYGVMEHLLGTEIEERQGEGGDEQARRIAGAGQQWAKKALRKEDAMIYLYRLLLEYARVVDPKRHTLGWVGDL